MSKAPTVLRVTARQKQSRQNAALLERELSRAQNRIQTVDLLCGMLSLAAGLLIYLLVVMSLDFWLRLPNWTRVALFGMAGVAAVSYAAWALLRPLLLKVNPYFAARRLESASPGSKNGLVNWLDLRGERLNPVIQDALQKNAVSEIDKADVEEAIPTRRPLRLGLIAGLLLLGMFFYFVLLPDQVGSLVMRALLPFRGTAIPTHTRIELVRPVEDRVSDTPEADEPLTFEVMPGDPVQFAALIHGVVPEDVWLEYQPTLQEKPIRKALNRPRDDAQREPWVLTLPSDAIPAEGLWFRLKAGDGQTRQYRLVVSAKKAPSISEVEVTLKYPEYSGRRDAKQNFAPVRGLLGTEVHLELVADQAVKEGTLLILVKNPEDQRYRHLDPIPLRPAKPNAAGEADPRRLVLEKPFVLTKELQGGALYRLSMTNLDGKLGSSPEYPIEIEADKVPIVKVLALGEQRFEGEQLPEKISLAANAVVPLEGKAWDDSAVRDVRLHLRLKDGAELGVYGSKPKETGLQKPTGFAPPPVDFQLTLDLTQLTEMPVAGEGKPLPEQFLKLKGGQVLELWVEATDGTKPEPNVGRSSLLVIELTEPQNQQQRQQQEQKADQKEKEADQKKQEREKKEQQNQQQNQDQPKEEQRPGDQKKEGEKNKEGKPDENQKPQGQEGGQPDKQPSDQKEQAGDKSGKQNSKDSESKPGDEANPGNQGAKGQDAKSQPDGKQPQGSDQKPNPGNQSKQKQPDQGKPDANSQPQGGDQGGQPKPGDKGAQNKPGQPEQKKDSGQPESKDTPQSGSDSKPEQGSKEGKAGDQKDSKQSGKEPAKGKTDPSGKDESKPQDKGGKDKKDDAAGKQEQPAAGKEQKQADGKDQKNDNKNMEGPGLGKDKTDSKKQGEKERQGSGQPKSEEKEQKGDRSKQPEGKEGDEQKGKPGDKQGNDAGQPKPEGKDQKGDKGEQPTGKPEGKEGDEQKGKPGDKKGQDAGQPKPQDKGQKGDKGEQPTGKPEGKEGDEQKGKPGDKQGQDAGQPKPQDKGQKGDKGEQPTGKPEGKEGDEQKGKPGDKQGQDAGQPKPEGKDQKGDKGEQPTGKLEGKEGDEQKGKPGDKQGNDAGQPKPEGKDQKGDKGEQPSGEGKPEGAEKEPKAGQKKPDNSLKPKAEGEGNEQGEGKGEKPSNAKKPGEGNQPEGSDQPGDKMPGKQPGKKEGDQPQDGKPGDKSGQDAGGNKDKSQPGDQQGGDQKGDKPAQGQGGQGDKPQEGGQSGEGGDGKDQKKLDDLAKAAKNNQGKDEGGTGGGGLGENLPKPDTADPDAAKKATDLVLEDLRKQLESGKIDKKLEKTLEEANLTADEARELLKQREKVRAQTAGRTTGPNRSEQELRRGATLNRDSRYQPPPELENAYRRFTEQRAKQSQGTPGTPQR